MITDKSKSSTLTPDKYDLWLKAIEEDKLAMAQKRRERRKEKRKEKRQRKALAKRLAQSSTAKSEVLASPLEK